MKIVFKNIAHKAIVFDMDGTLYPNYICEKQYHDFSIKAVMHYWDCPMEKAIVVLSDAKIASFTDSISIGSLTDLIISHGVSVKEWNQFREDNYYFDGFDKCESINVETLYKLKKLYYLFLVSNNTKKTIYYILQSINVPLEIFDNIYSSDDMMYYEKKMKKSYIYSNICAEYKLLPNQLIAIGDKFAVDIQPMIEIGGDGFEIDSPSEIEFIAYHYLL